MRCALHVLVLLGVLIASAANAQEAERKSVTVIRSIGRVVYENPRGELVGVDNHSVNLWEVANGPDLCWDVRIGGATTDEDGYFDFTTPYEPGSFVCDDSPDLRIEINVAGVTIRTAVVADFPGGTIDFGVIRQVSDVGNFTMHIRNVWTRANRWFEEQGHAIADPFWYNNLPSIDHTGPTRYNVIFWAGGTVTSSSRLNVADIWSESEIARLFAERWLYWNANYWELDGCNGVCDSAHNSAGSGDLGVGYSCGYCTWCPENGTVAWHQGIASWAASEIVDEFSVRYGDTPIDQYDFEHIQDCGVTAQTQWETPGLFAAVLGDISDSRNEHSALTPSFWDALAVGPQPILDIIASTTESHPAHFFEDFRAAHPEWCTELSLTARHNGYVIDTVGPAPVDDLASTSHSVGVPSTDATVELDWSAPADDCESAWQYSIRWGLSPQLPDAVSEVRGATNWTSDVLSPGTWYFTIRSADASGNWNGAYDSVGPIIIAPPTPANLTHVPSTGWAHRVTPRQNGLASSGNVPAPTVLTGNTKSTWWNASVGNIGGTSTGVGSGLWVQADGIGFYNPFDPVEHAASIPVLPGVTNYEALNLGPISVPGGRHTFGAYNDFTGLVAEDVETDNYWATQWVWTPYELPVGGSTSRSAPPNRIGGWAGAVSTTWFNCDGLRFSAAGTGVGWWNAVTLVANSRGADFDARMHVVSTGPTNGFGANVAYSTRPADCLDAVIANRNQVSNTNWDVGIVQASDETALATYEARHVTSTLETFGVPRVFSLAAYEYMSLHEAYIDADHTGPVSFTVRCLTSNNPFHISWLDDSFTTGSMDSYTETSASGEDGKARLDLTIPAAGYSCLVVYRDPKDGEIDAEDYIIEFDTTPPDLVPDQPAGWDAAVVARGAGDAVPGSATDPASIPGWSESTWLNVALANDGPVTAPANFEIALDLDGELIAPLYAPVPIAAGTGVYAQNLGPLDVRGGRHTVAMRLDDPDVVEEISETNNNFARQLAWSPQTLAFGPNLSIPMPADPYGSWEHLDWSSPELIWPNADGYHTPAFDPGGTDGPWGGVAVMPGASSDVTLRLHYAIYDIENSFGLPMASSGFGLGEIDFCLLNLTLQNPNEFDVGLSGGLGTEDSTFEIVSSSYLGDGPVGSYGVFQLAVNEMLDLHEVDLEAGFLRVRLENLTSSADLGISIYPPEVGALGRIDAIPDGTAWLNPAGIDEWVVCGIPVSGNYCIAVWKAGSASLPVTADYRLDFATVTATPPDAPVGATRIVSTQPNPFNPRTEIAFALESAGWVDLEIYDLRGRLVRRLAGADFAPGKHQTVWDGLDGSGRTVASGVYVVRFASGAVEQRRKITLVK